ncbi:unnamed protein product, partial [Didymodactylos carnosus]
SNQIAEENNDDDSKWSDTSDEENEEEGKKQQKSIASDIEDNDKVEEQDQEEDYTEDKSNNNLTTIYENLIVSKEDCVNHVKKRVITDLLKVKAVYSHFEVADGKRRRKLLNDGKPFGGSNGRMTTKTMNKISNYYGRAIRDASREVVDIWCSYQRDWLTNSNEGKNKEKLRLDPEFGKILHPMTTKLTNEGLLRRLREVAQNANESLNGIVCSRTLLAESFEETDININSLLLSNLLPNDEKRILRAKRLISQCDTILKEKSKKRLQAIQSMADKAEYGSVEY